MSPTDRLNRMTLDPHCLPSSLGKHHIISDVWQVVIRVRPMFDVEVEAGQTYAVQIAADDPHRLEARETPDLLSAQTSWSTSRRSLGFCALHAAHECTISWVVVCCRTLQLGYTGKCVPMPAVQVTEATLDPRAPPLTRSFGFHGCLAYAIVFHVFDYIILHKASLHTT